MKTYYKNPRTGTIVEFDDESNTAIELVRIGELVEIAEPAAPKKKGRVVELPGPRNSRPKINPPEIRKADDGSRSRYTEEEKATIIKMWKRDEDVSDIAVAVGRKKPTVQAYIYALIVKGELQKRSKAGNRRRSVSDFEGDTGTDDIDDGQDEME